MREAAALILILGLAGNLGAGEAAEPPRPRHDDEPHRVVEAIARLKLPDRAERLRALKTIQHFPDKAIPFLIKAARSEDALFRARVANALGLVGKGNGDALWALGVLLKDPNAFVRREAIAALVRAGDAAQVEPIRALLADPVTSVRADAVAAIADLDPDHAAENMKQLLGHEDPGVRRAALAWLVGKKAEGLDEILLRLVKDPDGGVRGDAAAALAGLAWDKVGEAALKINDPKARERLFDEAAQADEGARKAADTLMDLLDDPDPYVVSTAVLWLKQMRVRRAVPRLVGLLESKSESVRGEAISALGVLGGRTVLPALTSQLTAASPTLRERAAMAIGLVGKPALSAAPGLIQLLGDTSESVRQKADLALQLILGTSVGFRAGASVEERQEAIAKWQETWQKAKKP